MYCYACDTFQFRLVEFNFELYSVSKMRYQFGGVRATIHIFITFHQSVKSKIKNKCSPVSTFFN